MSNDYYINENENEQELAELNMQEYELYINEIEDMKNERKIKQVRYKDETGTPF